MKTLITLISIIFLIACSDDKSGAKSNEQAGIEKATAMQKAYENAKNAKKPLPKITTNKEENPDLYKSK